MFHQMLRCYLTGDQRRWKAYSLDAGVCASGQTQDEALENLQAALQRCLRDRGATTFESIDGQDPPPAHSLTIWRAAGPAVLGHEGLSA